jgi:hypothetical protein
MSVQRSRVQRRRASAVHRSTGATRRAATYERLRAAFDCYNDLLGSSCAAAWPRDSLRGRWVCDELGGRPARSRHELTTTIRASAGEDATCTHATVGALERTNEEVGRIGWHVAITAFAVRAQLEHRQLLAKKTGTSPCYLTLRRSAGNAKIALKAYHCREGRRGHM